MAELSPAARKVLTAATQRLYCLDPEDVPLSASEHGSAIAAALRAVADQVVPEEPPLSGGMRPGGTAALTLDEAQGFQRAATRRRVIAIATELENHQ